MLKQFRIAHALIAMLAIAPCMPPLQARVALAPKPSFGVMLEKKCPDYTAQVHIFNKDTSLNHFDNGNTWALNRVDFFYKALVDVVITGIISGLIRGNIHSSNFDLGVTRVSSISTEYRQLHETYAPIVVTITNTSDQPLLLPQHYLPECKDALVTLDEIKKFFPSINARLIGILPIMALFTACSIGGGLGAEHEHAHGEDRRGIHILLLTCAGTLAWVYMYGSALINLLGQKFFPTSFDGGALLMSPQTGHTISPLQLTHGSYSIPPKGTFKQVLYAQRSKLPAAINLSIMKKKKAAEASATPALPPETTPQPPASA